MGDLAELQRHVDSGIVAGLIALAARGDEIAIEVLGTPSYDDSTPLQRDAIFRIASMTKPVTGAGVMVLVDDGAVGLDDPVDEWLPELADRRVLRGLDSELDDTIPAKRPITVTDLLSCRLGTGCIMAMPDSLPIQRAEAALGLRTFYQPWPPTTLATDQWLAGLGSLPLAHQPGEGWLYNTGIDVAGTLIERVSGRSLEEFFTERIFAPLGMVDTAFSVPAGKLSRFTTSYEPDPETGAMNLFDPADSTSMWASPVAKPSPSGWLVSTVDDFWAFARMMRDGGIGNQTRILSEESVAEMQRDRTTAAERAASEIFLGTTHGWGLGMTVPLDGVAPPAVGRGFGWDGGLGTTWRHDPATGISGILLTQRAMTSPEPPPLFDEFWASAYSLFA